MSIDDRASISISRTPMNKDEAKKAYDTAKEAYNEAFRALTAAKKACDNAGEACDKAWHVYYRIKNISDIE